VSLYLIDLAARRVFNERVDRGTHTVGLLARQIGASVSHVSNWRNGKKGMSVKKLDRVLSVLGVVAYSEAKRPNQGRGL
jgi:transcriptional regulator with XRE-family HTH domain